MGDESSKTVTMTVEDARRLLTYVEGVFTGPLVAHELSRLLRAVLREEQ